MIGRRFWLAGAALLAASPAAASEAPWYSIENPHTVEWVGFLIFVAVLIYFKVPQVVARMLDQRAESIRRELDEARSIREEAQALLASVERKLREAAQKREDMIARAREDARLAAEQAKADLQKMVERRIRTAEEQIAAAEEAALKEVRNRAVEIAVAAAAEVIRERMTAKDANALIEQSIETVGRQLH
ncbi:MAG: ATP F0F1 synthase subunit B [Alphaproteobacteria bacterium]|nr:MAG: ATP F0F1 synthase subunit B [Alphaproteobacteria bacterium]